MDNSTFPGLSPAAANAVDMLVRLLRDAEAAGHPWTADKKPTLIATAVHRAGQQQIISRVHDGGYLLTVRVEGLLDAAIAQAKVRADVGKVPEK